MKKILALLFVLVLVFSLSSCGQKLIPLDADKEQKNGAFLEIDCSDVFSVKAGETINCKIHFYTDGSLVQIAPAILSVIGNQNGQNSSTSNQKYTSDDGRQFNISAIYSGTPILMFRYNFTESRWELNS